MKATELRIGNLVSINGETICVENIDEFGVNISYDSGWYGSVERNAEGLFIPTGWSSDDRLVISPIPLTEEWLVKFGFEKQNHIYKSKDGVRFDEYNFMDDSGFGMRWCNGYLEFTDDFGADCPFVHTLQNIYFSLTGEELTLKSEKQSPSNQ